MLARERQEVILEHLRLYGRVRATEIAQELGVSEITIRRDLNELHAAGMLSRIHGGAVRKGQEAAGGGRTLIGVVVPESIYYYAEVIRGAESLAESVNARLVLATARTDSLCKERVNRLLALGAEGILLASPIGDGQVAGMEDWLSDVPVPVVLMERSFTFPAVARELDHVRSDHAYGGLLALRHLQSLGHESVAVVIRTTPTSYWLERGARDAERVLGLDGRVAMEILPEGGAEEAEEALGGILDRNLEAGTKAFFVHNDAIASALVDVALERGLRVPGDVAVVAYDDVTASMAAVPLTAIAPPKREIGALALEQLVRRLRQSPERPQPVSHQSLLPALQVRSSCGAAMAEARS